MFPFKSGKLFLEEALSYRRFDNNKSRSVTCDLIISELGGR